MTLEELKTIPNHCVTANDIAPILETDPNIIRFQAHEEPEKLGFPVIVIKSRVKIPRKPFIKFIEEGIDYV